jgi:WD40 repeat protein
MLNGTRMGGDERALLQVLAAWPSAPTNDAAMALVTALIERPTLTKIWKAGGPVQSVAFHPDGKQLVSGSDDHTIQLWDAKTGQPIGLPWKGHRDRVMSVAFTHSGKPIGSPWTKDTNGVISVAFSPMGTRVVSGSDYHTLRLWDA